jgi:hypothetical protein
VDLILPRELPILGARPQATDSPLHTQLGILFSFQGIYQTIVPPTGTNNLSFSSASLASYVETYFWGLAIALFANALVWPVSAEYECRELLVTSLQHLSILAHLTCKTHDKSIDLGEAVRSSLGLIGLETDDVLCRKCEICSSIPFEQIMLR